MTGLGALVYFGFFGVAALWLFVTSERFNRTPQEEPDQSQVPELSNSDSVSAGPVGSNACCASQSSLK